MRRIAWMVPLLLTASAAAASDEPPGLAASAPDIHFDVQDGMELMCLDLGGCYALVVETGADGNPTITVRIPAPRPRPEAVISQETCAPFDLAEAGYPGAVKGQIYMPATCGRIGPDGLEEGYLLEGEELKAYWRAQREKPSR